MHFSHVFASHFLNHFPFFCSNFYQICRNLEFCAFFCWVLSFFILEFFGEVEKRACITQSVILRKAFSFQCESFVTMRANILENHIFLSSIFKKYKVVDHLALGMCLLQPNNLGTYRKVILFRLEDVFTFACYDFSSQQQKRRKGVGTILDGLNFSPSLKFGPNIT